VVVKNTRDFSTGFLTPPAVIAERFSLALVSLSGPRPVFHRPLLHPLILKAPPPKSAADYCATENAPIAGKSPAQQISRQPPPAVTTGAGCLALQPRPT
jgi:hypothetical protein